MHLQLRLHLWPSSVCRVARMVSLDSARLRGSDGFSQEGVIGKMEYRVLGNTRIKLSIVGFGTSPL
jgi:hypothetical protein